MAKPGSVITIAASIFFRLALYALIYVCVDIQNNAFDKNYCILAILLHTSFYIFAKIKSFKYSAQLRLLSDYSLIAFVLYGKGLGSLLNISLLLLPIVNMGNYTGRFSWISSLNPYFAALGAALIIDKTAFPLILFPLFFFWVISLFSRAREYNNQIELTISDLISDYNELAVYSSKRKVFSSIVDKLNSDAFFKIIENSKILNILCFQRRDDKLSLISSSGLDVEFKLNLLNSSRIKDQLAFDPEDFVLNIDGKTVSRKDLHPITISTKDNKYLFIVVFSGITVLNITFRRVFNSVFNKFARTLDVESNIASRNRQLRSEMNKRAEFIHDAVNNTHFINNELGPIQAHLEILKYIDSNKGSVFNKQLEIKAKDEEQKARTSLELIVQKNRKLLEKANNPLEALHKREISIEDLIVLIRSNWNTQLNENNIKNSLPDKDSSATVLINTYAFETLLDEIGHNMVKYSQNRDSCSCTINIEQSQAVIFFLNDVKPNQVNHIVYALNEFNNSIASDQLKQHGLSIINTTCKTLGTTPIFDLKNNIFSLSITLQLVNK